MSELHLFESGHTACAGCGQAIAARLVVDAAGKNTIVANNTGCLEVFSSKAPESSWGVPWIHSLFENAAAVASGVESALKFLGKKENINIIAQGGDGSTADIGFGALSGMFERGHDVLYVCYDNEAYMNCLSTSSLIMTKEGLKKITEVKVGEEVAAFNQKTYQLVYKKCSGVFDNGIKEVFELKTLHHAIKATGNHPFLVLKRNGRGKHNSFVWKILEEIKEGDEIVTLKNLKEGESFKFNFDGEVKKGDYKVNKLNEVNIPKTSSVDLMKYLGLYVGDGWIRSERGEIGFALPEGSKGRKDLINLHSKIFGNSLRTNETYIYINSVNQANFMNSLGFGKGAKHKKIPGWIFTLPKEEKESFISGLMLSDGYQIGRSCRYVSASENLLKSLRLLLQTVDYRVGKIHWQTKSKGTKCVKRKLLKEARYGYICFSKKEKWNTRKYPSQYRYQNFLIDNEYFNTEKVRSIKSVGYEPTLDLRVEDEHNFIADGIVVHNTGVQRSGLTPFDANTTTSPPGRASFGNWRPKKDLISIAVAHHIPYVASASVGYPLDVQKKVKKALSVKGPKYIQIFVPCPLGWRHTPVLTPTVAKLVVETGLYPLVEYENGELISVKKLKEIKPVEEYLKLQRRFAHLFKTEEGKEEIEKIQEIANAHIEKFKLKG
jgi:pyruvate/2-oxoacid:ferredoxin oxidoreductase beta subunit